MIIVFQLQNLQEEPKIVASLSQGCESGFFIGGGGGGGGGGGDNR